MTLRRRSPSQPRLIRPLKQIHQHITPHPWTRRLSVVPLLLRQWVLQYWLTTPHPLPPSRFIVPLLLLLLLLGCILLLHPTLKQLRQRDLSPPRSRRWRRRFSRRLVPRRALLHREQQLLAVASRARACFAGHEEPVDEFRVRGGFGGVGVVLAEHDDVTAVRVDVGGFTQGVGEVVEAAAVEEEEGVVFGPVGGGGGEGDDEDGAFEVGFGPGFGGGGPEVDVCVGGGGEDF